MSSQILYNLINCDAMINSLTFQLRNLHQYDDLFEGVVEEPVEVEEVVEEPVEVMHTEPTEQFTKLFQEVAKEIVQAPNSYILKRTSNLFRIEFKDAIKIRRGLLSRYSRNLDYEPKYTGRCYHTRYISKYNKKIASKNTIGRISIPKWDEIKDDTVVKEWFARGDREFNEKNWDDYSRCLDSITGWNRWRDGYSYETDNFKPAHHTIKIRGVKKILNYERSIISNSSLTYLKIWNRDTNKTTNRGLKAIHPTWTVSEDDKERGGWNFSDNVLTIHTVEKLALQNGFKPDVLKITNKGKKNEAVKYKSHQYGEYAEFLMTIYGGKLTYKITLEEVKTWAIIKGFDKDIPATFEEYANHLIEACKKMEQHYNITERTQKKKRNFLYNLIPYGDIKKS